MTTAVVVFAKAPVPGLAKTRLVPALGEAGAAALAERMLRHALAQAVAADIGPVVLCATPDAPHPMLRDMAAACGAALLAQGTGDLGARMARALRRQLRRWPRALLVGTDAPALGARQLREAARALADHDAVFVPTHDGGYVLVGQRRPGDPRCFRGMTWSHPQVMADTRRRLADAGLSWLELAPVVDIDEPADLASLPPEWRAGHAPGVR
ncbi:MAG: TIGR04282 family arsenosugar biosynthesis glycosyltransferase [Rhodospirillales bacterium]